MAGGRGKLRPEDNPKPFSSTYQPLNNGRKPKVFSQIANEFKARGIEKATAAIVEEAYEYLLALPLSEIIEIGGNPKIENDMPSLMRLAAKEMVGRRGLEILKEMLDRAHGRAKQAIDHTTKGESITYGGQMAPDRFEALKAIAESE